MTHLASSGAAAAANSDRRFECRICWYLYDPAEGDEMEQVPPGTAFHDLPDHWRCPQCDAESSMFLPADD